MSFSSNDVVHPETPPKAICPALIEGLLEEIIDTVGTTPEPFKMSIVIVAEGVQDNFQFVIEPLKGAMNITSFAPEVITEDDTIVNGIFLVGFLLTH